MVMMIMTTLRPVFNPYLLSSDLHYISWMQPVGHCGMFTVDSMVDHCSSCWDYVALKSLPYGHGMPGNNWKNYWLVIWRIQLSCFYGLLPSVLWHCWLGVRKCIRLYKNWVMRCWCGCLLEWDADCLHIVRLMPLHPKTPSSLASLKSRLVYLSGTGLPRLSWKTGC